MTILSHKEVGNNKFGFRLSQSPVVEHSKVNQYRNVGSLLNVPWRKALASLKVNIILAHVLKPNGLFL